MSEPKTSVRRVEAVDRQQQALELRKGGKTFEYIAEKLGYASKAGAHKAVLSALQKTLQEPADDLRKLEIERLDVMFEAIWWAASHGTPHAIDRALKIMEHKAKLLGLNAPVRYQQVFEDEVARISEATGTSPSEIWAEINSAVEKVNQK